MAPLTWKLLLSTATLAGGQQCSANDSCEDQTALLQSHLASHKSSLANAESQAQMLNFPKMSTLADPTKRHTALAQFEHTALELAQNSASVTPEVVQVCQMTTELLTDTVLRAIEEEHNTDQATVDSAREAFVPIQADRDAKEALILDAAAGVGMTWDLTVPTPGGEPGEMGDWIKNDDGGCAAAVIECRTTLSRVCLDCHTCRETCIDELRECELCDDRLQEAHAHVIETLELHSEPVCDAHGGIHPPSSETYEAMVSLEDHEANAIAMQAYIALIGTEGCTNLMPCEPTRICRYERHSLVTGQVDEITAAEHAECTVTTGDPPVTPNCPDHIDEMGHCETTMAACQATSCAASIDVALQLTLYQQSFRDAVLTYYRTKGRVEVTEADRKVEWDTLERVICLLNTLTNDEAGSASSSTTEARIAACQADDIPEITVGEPARGTAHLDINYPDVPSLGDLPKMPPTPCEDAYEAITCAGLPGDVLPPYCGGDQTIIDIFYPPPQPDPVCECSAVAPTPLVIPDIIAEVYPMPVSGVQPRPYAATDQQRAAEASMMVVENGGQFAAVPPPPFEYSDQDTALADAGTVTTQ